MSDRDVADLGEFGLIEALTARFSAGPEVLCGPGDDAAVLRLPAGEVLLATDLLVEGRHFRRDWCSADDVGHRCAAQSLSDLNAMGGRSTGLTVGLALPGSTRADWVLEWADGLEAEAVAAGAHVVGGDVTHSDVLTISVTALGYAECGPVARSGARAGDMVAVHGRLGWAAAGLAVLRRGFGSPRAVVEAYRRPRIDYTAGPAAAAAGATSLIDVSDGLVADLGHVARASGVVVALTATAFVVDEPLQAVGAALGVDPAEFVMTGGDDHALAATFPRRATLPPGWSVVGEVLGRGVLAGDPGVIVDGDPYPGAGGWRHF